MTDTQNIIDLLEQPCRHRGPDDVVLINVTTLRATVALLEQCTPTWELVDTLRAMHDEQEDYNFINNLGGYNNHNMRRARAVLIKMGVPFAPDRSSVPSRGEDLRSRMHERGPMLEPRLVLVRNTRGYVTGGRYFRDDKWHDVPVAEGR